MSEHKERLELPAPEDARDDKPTLELDSTMKMDNLGPMIVNSDGTLSRISNWQEMSEIERARTVKVLLKRNKIRLDTLEAAETGRHEGTEEKGKDIETE
ncbi:hypothetical protein FRB91_001193 [Serendipita sp. 411]|nr:hypothetical protein FRC15_011956 [Serendipita sp. 397]KAG8786304.1 hypothetical protein FRC16_001756 [Serendipita sp. 398]KAG8824096.1 hypothetical protein FRC19_002551 [Serendipita sp. 401]KAG8834049.1 hypothetical protein FRC18_002681 [Serendipita sp. 400]KAG8856134.1 hypothetical protein FRB91_001193 [Serendipita sp. 411]KAG8867082.1 hypothetical protein FRC20_006753 [Serendipita sp. 405]KAG9055570.1 hypothetical protein FS842_001844 [Serendipita sp. 407]